MPCESGDSSAPGRRDCREHQTSVRIDLADLILGDLEKMLTVECSASVCGDVERLYDFPAARIEGLQRASGCEPNSLSIVSDTAYLLDAREGPVLTNDRSCRLFHRRILSSCEGSREQQSCRESWQ